MNVYFFKSCFVNNKLLLRFTVVIFLLSLSADSVAQINNNPAPISTVNLLLNLKEKIDEAEGLHKEVEILRNKIESNLKEELERQKRLELEIGNVELIIIHEKENKSKIKEELLNNELEIQEYDRQINQNNEITTKIQNELDKIQKLYDDCVKDSWILGVECDIADMVVNYKYPRLDLLKKEIQTLNNQKIEKEGRKRLAKAKQATIENVLVILNKKVEEFTDKKSSLDKEINSSKSIVENLNNVLFQFKSRLADLKNSIKEFGDEIITTENPKARRIKTMNEEITKIIEKIIEIKKS